MDGVNKLDEMARFQKLLDPDVEKQTFGRKSQNWQNLKEENGILLMKKPCYLDFKFDNIG
ncbi:hypothetical protein Hanom_Chr07g00650501 [Helianthus anomalus]